MVGVDDLIFCALYRKTRIYFDIERNEYFLCFV